MVTTVRYRRRRQSSNGRTDATQGELPAKPDARAVACDVEAAAERLLRPNALVSELECSSPSCPTRRNGPQEAFRAPE
jgi:hypothetical protein